MPVCTNPGTEGDAVGATRSARAYARRLRAAAGAALFLGIAPGVVAGVIPWMLTEWRGGGVPIWLRALGWVGLSVGVAVLVEAFGRFVIEGIGTPAPVAPTEKLVVGGLYRYVRNPMYLAVAAVILGQAAVLGRWILIAYTAVFGLTVWSFVHWYEEPTLRRRFGQPYDEYVATVPGWRPRRPQRRSPSRCRRGSADMSRSSVSDWPRREMRGVRGRPSESDPR